MMKVGLISFFLASDTLSFAFKVVGILCNCLSKLLKEGNVTQVAYVVTELI